MKDATRSLQEQDHEIRRDVTVGELVVCYPQLRQRLEHLGLDYCCGGKTPLGAAVEKAGLKWDAVLATLEEALASGSADNGGADWSNAPLGQLADHILDKHHAFMKEEQILFPAIKGIDAFMHGTGGRPVVHCGSIANPIRQMEHEHDSAGDALAEMRQTTGNYQLPADACQSFAALYDGLKAMEADLHEHIHLENNILFPRSVRQEGRMGDDRTGICWTILLRPKLQEGYSPDRVDLSPPPPTGISKCVGAYPVFRMLQASDCGCGLIGDGKSVLDAEDYLRSFGARRGVLNVEIAWYWGAEAPPCMKTKRLDLAAFCRMNEAKALEPDTRYEVS